MTTSVTPSNPVAVPPITTDQWVAATWEEFLVAEQVLEPDQARCYYDSGWMRIETMPVGAGHSQDNTLATQVVSLFCLVRNLRLKGFTNGSFQRRDEQECQPDMAFYVGDEIPDPFPPKTTEVVDVDRYGPPTLVIEVASTTLGDDLGRKRLLYERLGVREYWILDVLGAEIFGFAIADGGSRPIEVSRILPGLPMNLIKEALSLSHTLDDTEMARWLMEQFGSFL